MNKTPVVGIITTPFNANTRRKANATNLSYNSYLQGNFVDFYKAQGVRLVPIIYGEPVKVTRDKVSRLNGIVYPGAPTFP